jgi:predicted N-acetyltransferase YhbS
VYVSAFDDRVVGYYALAMSSVERVGAPGKLARGMPGQVPVLLLARLAVDSEWQGQGNGGRLLVDALRRCVRGGREFGARAVIVDAVDEQAYAFYQHFGFKDFEGQRLWRKLSDIASALDR